MFQKEIKMINELQKKYDDIIYHANRIMLNGPEEFIKLFDEFVNWLELGGFEIYVK